jgi:hypothetical protein
MCHGLLSSPMVAHFSRILKGKPFSTLASQIPFPLFTESRIFSCESISAKRSTAKLIFISLFIRAVLTELLIGILPEGGV